MKKLLIIFLLLGLTAGTAKTYSQEDWKVYNACKDKVYNNVYNEHNYDACKEMLNHKKALHKYGASSSYNYWMKRLN